MPRPFSECCFMHFGVEPDGTFTHYPHEDRAEPVSLREDQLGDFIRQLQARRDKVMADIRRWNREEFLRKAERRTPKIEVDLGDIKL